MQHIGFIGASGLMGHGMAKNIRAKGFDLSITVHQALNTAVALGYGSEMVPSLIKAQALLNQVKIGPA